MNNREILFKVFILQTHIIFEILHLKRDLNWSLFKNGGRYWTRTSDPHNVNVMRYQLRQPPIYLVLKHVGSDYCFMPSSRSLLFAAQKFRSLFRHYFSVPSLSLSQPTQNPPPIYLVFIKASGFY